MNDFKQLLAILENQFGPFLREEKYQEAFNQAIQTLRNIAAKESTSTIDSFYLFLHALVIELFSEVERLNNQIQTLKAQT